MKNTLLYVIEGREHDVINVDQHESFECFAILQSDSKWFNTSVFRGKHKLQIIWQMIALTAPHSNIVSLSFDSADSVIWRNIILILMK